MSYAPVAGKIAGLGFPVVNGRAHRRSLRGLGDAARDNAVLAFAADHASWANEVQQYQAAYAAWQNQAQAISVANKNKNLAYAAAQAQYDQDLAHYTLARNDFNGQSVKNQRAYAAAQAAALAQYPGLVIPAGTTCVTQAQHDAWASNCKAAAVKGLGATPSGPYCGLASLPVCTPPIPAPAAMYPRPAPPTLQALPLEPQPPRAEPQPPAAPTSPAPTTTSSPSTTPSVLVPSHAVVPDSLPAPSPVLSPAPTVPAKSAGILSNGLLLIVLAGGSYALYRTFKKPKKAA